ncbi:ATP-binding protein [Bacillus cereus]|uniref:ATP-binding protein n=1 Tax=Bacillus cereus TaxID=1396 RepID=UPI003B679090
MTNINFKSWHEVLQDPKLANAILDCVLHHATEDNLIEFKIISAKKRIDFA